MAVDLLNDKNYTEANLATKKAIFDKHVGSLPDYANANDATKSAIRKKYGIDDIAVSTTVPKPPVKEEEGFFSKALDYVTDIPVGVFNWFSPKQSSSEGVTASIKSEQTKDRSLKPQEPDLKKDLEKDKMLFDMFKRDAAFDLQKQGVKYDDSLLNQEALKKLNNLGYTQQPFSNDNPTLVFKPGSPKLSSQEIEDARMKAAQSYQEKIQNLESELSYPSKFLGTGDLWQLTKAIAPQYTEYDDQVKKQLAILEKEKKEVDEQYKAAQVFQSNKYTANQNGILPGFIGSQLDPKDAILDPDAATSIINNSYNTLFKNDEIGMAKSSPEGKEAYKKSLVEKSVFANNEFRENALVELKAMEEEKSNTDIIANKLGLDFLQTEGEKERFLRGYSSLDQQYHLAQQIKREKDPIIQSLNQDKQYKQMYEESMKEYLSKKKTGQGITIDGKTLDEKWFQSAMQASSALDKSIKKKEEDLNYLESLEINDTKEFKKFQENQKVFNETGDKARATFSILDSVKDLLRTGEKLGDVLYITLGAGDETVEFRGQKLSRKDIESAKLFKPLRNIDQYYELIPEIGETAERVKAIEAEGIRLFDKEGSFSPDIDMAALAGQSVKVAGISRILGFTALAEEMTAGAFLKGALGETSKIGLKELTKTGARNIASELAKRSVMKASNVTLGYILPTNLLMGSDNLKRYIQKGYNYDQSWSLATIDNTIEALTECIFPNDANIVKNSILKGEIKTAEELAQNEIYKGAFKKAYKAWTGKNLSDRLYNTFKAYGPSAKEAAKILLEETGEEIGGEALTSLAYRSGMSQKNPILDEPGNFTFDNIANIAVSTMATMLWTGKQAFTQDLSQRDATRQEYQYIVGRNTQPYIKSTLDLFGKNEITDEETKRRLKAISEYESLYQQSEAFSTITPGFSGLKENEKEVLKQKTFKAFAKKTNLEKAILEAPTEEEKSRLLELLDSANFEINDLKLGLYKSEEERVKLNVDTTKYFINDNSIKSFTDLKQINNLIGKYESYKQAETNKDIIASYDSAIKLLNDRKSEVEKQAEEEKKTPEEKVQESASKGIVKIKDAKGVEKEFQIGKKYIVGRQIAFGKANPVRFPEVTFLGYKTDENGEIVKDENGSPIVIAETVNTKNEKVRVERPISTFEDYNLGTEEGLKYTSAGRFFNKFKSKKFVLGLKDAKGKTNWVYNSLVSKAKQDLEGIDELEGYLSAESEKGEPVIYFNFVNPKTGKEGYYRLTDKMIDYTQKKGGYLRPKEKTLVTKAGQVIIKANQYEDLTPEEMEEMGYFTEKELEQYKKYVEAEDFSDLKNKRLSQEKRRREYINQYIAKVSKKLTDIVENISKLTAKVEENKELINILNNLKPFLNIVKVQNVKVDELAKVLPKTKINQFSKLTSPYDKVIFLKEEINSRLERYSKEVDKNSKKLAELEEEKARVQPAIDQELAFLEDIDVEEFDYSESIIPQLKEKRNAVKEALQENEKLVADARGNISSLESVIATLKEALDKLFDSIERFTDPEGYVKTSEELRKNIAETTKAIDGFIPTVTQLEAKSKSLNKDIQRYNKLINFLEKLEKEHNKQTSGFVKEAIKEFLFAQQEPASENGTDKNETDKQLSRDEGSTKKYFSDLFNSTISFGYNYEEELKDPKNNYANARLDYFLNTFKKSFALGKKDLGIRLLPINKKNAAKYGLEGILYQPEIDTDVKLVVVEKTTNGYIFLDMNGNAIESKDGKVSPDQVIYTSLQKATLVDSEGNPKYNLKDFDYLKAKFPKKEDREKEIEKIANQALKKYEEFRNKIVNSENPESFRIEGISRGIPQYAKTNSQGIQRNPVRGTLLTEDTTSFKGKIKIADKPIEEGSKLGVINDHNGKPVRMPLGRPVIWDEKTKTFQFADNHPFSKNQKEALVAVIKTMAAEIIDNYNKKKTDPTVKVVPTKYTKFLSGLTYWRNPSKNVNNAPQDSSTIKDNQLWLDFSEGEAMLMIGSTNKVSLKDLLAGDILLEAVVESLYHNVNMKNLGNPFLEYYLDNNKLKERIWKSYEDYLLSDKYPDGTIRPTSEIPLTTSVIPNDSPFDENNDFQENYNPQYRSRYMTFSAPELEVKQNTSPIPAEQPVQKDTPTPAKTSSKNAETVNTVNEKLQKIISINPNKEKVISNWKNTIKNLKENVVYTFVNTSARAISLNNEIPNFFSFTVKIEKDGTIKVNSFNSNITEEFNEVVLKSLPNFEISKKSLETFINFLAYNISDSSTIESFLPFESFEITEEQQEVKPAKEEPEFISAEDLLEGEEAPTEEKKPITQIKRGRKKPDAPFRVAKGEAKIKENLEEAKKWFKEKFSNLEFSIVEGLIDGVAWGKFTQNGIILSRAAEIGTVYHEAFEVVAGLFLNKRQWEDLKREFKSRQGTYVDRETGKVVKYSQATDHQIKEQLAEEYRDYELSNGKSVLSGQYKRNSLFRRMWNAIKSLLFGDPKDIKDLFSKISQGQYRDKAPVKWNRPFDLEKSYRIVNLQDDLFFYQLNKSLTLYTFKNFFQKDRSFESLFSMNEAEYKEMYKQMKSQLDRDYFHVEDENGEFSPLTDYVKFDTLEECLDNFDEFFDQLNKFYNEGLDIPKVLNDIYAVNNDQKYSDEEYAAIVKNKVKDALLAYAYITNNWTEVANKNSEYIKKYGISYEEDLQLDEEDEDVTTGENEDKENEDNPEFKARDEYSKDPFSLFLKNTANSKVKLLIATIPVITKFTDSNGEEVIAQKLNDLGLPETTEFAKEFRKVVSTVIEQPTLLDQLNALKEATNTHPELQYLYNKLGGNLQADEIAKNKDLWNLRLAFSQSFNKQRFGFSRVVMRREESFKNGKRVLSLLTNLVDSLESSSYRAIVKRYLNNFKEVIAKNPDWLDKETSSYNIPSNSIPSLTRDIAESIPFLNELGFDIPYDINVLSEENKKELFEIVKEIVTFIRGGKAKLENLKDFNFSKHVADLARFEYKITKDAGEVQHRNIEGMPQSNDVSQNSISIVYKALNAAKNVIGFQLDFPRFNDVFTQNALWRSLYFENGDKNEINLRVESAEGIVEINGKGKHTSKLPYSTRILQEFIYNIIGDSKNFRTPGFYVITPADIKTEEVIKWGKVLVEKEYLDTETGVFDYVLRGYLADEINLARELSKDDRGLKAYRKQITGPFEGKRQISKTLRFFNDILSFDYTDVIDSDIDVNEWINTNKDRILKDIDTYFDKEADDTFKIFEAEGILKRIGNTDMYDFLGMETQALGYLDDKFGTNLKETLKKTGEVTISKQDMIDIMKYRAVNYFVNVNEQSKLFFGDIGQFGDLSKRVKSFVSTRETTAYDNYSTNGEVYTTVAKQLMNKVTYTDEFGNEETVDIDEGVPGYQSFESEFKASTVKDAMVFQKSIPYIQNVHEESLAKDLFFSEFKDLPKNIQKYITKTISEFVKPFADVNEADGQAYMTLPLFRQFLHRSTMWNNDLEELYNYHMAYERNKRNQYAKYVNGDQIREIDLKILKKGDPNEKRVLEGKDPINYPVIKPIGAGVRPGSQFITTLDKCSVAPIHYKLLEGKPSLDMYISGIDNDTNYFRFESAHKVGTPAEMQTPYNSEGKANPITQTDTLSFQDYAVQVETRGLKEKVTRGTQPLKIAFLNLMEAGIPADYIRTIHSQFEDKINTLKSTLTEDFDIEKYSDQWKVLRDEILSQAKKQWDLFTKEEKRNSSEIYKNVDDHNEVLKSLTDRYFEGVSEDFSIVKNQDDTYTISDYSEFKDALVKQLKDRKAAENLLKQLEIEDGKFIQPFDFIIGADKLEPILMAIINTRVVQPKIKGKSLAQIASTFFENSPRTYVKKIYNEEQGTFTYEEVKDPDPSDKNIYLTSGDLLFYGDDYVEENGVARKATAKEIADGVSKKANFMEVYLPAIFKDTLGNIVTDFSKIDPELLKGLGYRIPTQEMSSMENIRIKGFLPLEYQNGVVVPSAITAKAGSDFDIDKLTAYLYHYYFSATENKVKKIQYLDDSNSTAEERYIEAVKERLFKGEDIFEDDEIADSLKLEVIKEMDKNFTKIVKEKFKNSPVFELQKSGEVFKKAVETIKSYPDKAFGNNLLDIIYSKEVMYDKYKKITDLVYQKSETESAKNKALLNKLQLDVDNIFAVDESVSNLLRVLKKISKKTAGYALMKGAMKEKTKEVLARYVYMYSIPVKGVPVYQDFLNLPVSDQNTTRALENKYIDAVLNLVGLEENRNRLVNPNSMETLRTQADKMDQLKEKARKEAKPEDLEVSKGGSHQDKLFAKYGSANNNANTRYSFQVGKPGVGIGAVGMTNLAVNQWLDSVLLDPAIEEISLYFPVNKVNGETSMTFRRDAKGKWVSNTNSEFINGFVDIAKDPIIIKIHGTLATTGTYLFANKIGIPMDYAVSLMNQPIIVEYEQLEERAQSSIGKIRIAKNGGNAFTYAALQIKNKYGELSEDYQPKMFKLSDLDAMIENANNLSEDQKQDQLKLFDLYTTLKEYSNELRQAVGTYNFDTDIQRSIGAVNSKVVSNAEYERDPGIVIYSENTFFSSMKNAVINFTSAVQPLFKVYSEKYKKYINPIFLNLSNIADKNSRDAALDDVKRGFANYLLLTIPYTDNVGDKTKYLQDGSYTLQSLMDKLLIETETSVVTRLKPLQERMKKGEIPTNFALQELFRLVKDSKRGTNNLTVFNRSKEPEYIDLMANSLQELQQSNDNEIKQLAKDINRLALLQSGLNQSNVSISQYIPADAFTQLSARIIEALDEINPVVLDKHLKNFKKMYYANKWMDPKFTTKVNYKVTNREDLSKNPMIISPVIAVKFNQDEKLTKINLEFSKFQIVKYIMKSETEDRDFKEYAPILFQRVEDESGSPLLVKKDEGYSFVYKQVTPLGQGQYSLEFTSKSRFNDNVDEDSNSDIIANFAESDMQVMTVDELFEQEEAKEVLPVTKPVPTAKPTTTTPTVQPTEEVQLTSTQNSKVEITKTNYTRQEVQSNPNDAYVFTENTHSITAFPNRAGGGSAIIRGLSNAFAIVTKKKYDYNTKENVDYSDTDANFKEFVDINTKLINDLKNSGKSKIIFPQGFATDKAKMPTRFAEWLQKALLDNFGLVTELNSTKTGLISKDVSKQLTSTQDKRNVVAIIGTAGRKEVPSEQEWNNMVKDAERRVNKNDILISGGAAFADHIAVKLFLEGKVAELKLRLPAPFKNGKFEGAYGTSGGAANYYHQQFSKVIGENTLAQIQEAIDKGAEVTYEPLAQGYSAMMNRNTKVANESNKMLAYTYGEGNTPADGATKDTWDKSKGEKTHISINKIDLTQPQTSTQEPTEVQNLEDPFKC